MDRDNFYVHLPSNSSSGYFPHNTISHYITKLPQTIELDGEWEVGLAEIFFPLYFDNVIQFHASNKPFTFPVMQYPDIESLLSILFRRVLAEADNEKIAVACIDEFLTEAHRVLPKEEENHIVTGISTTNKVNASTVVSDKYVEFSPLLYGTPRQLIGGFYGGAQTLFAAKTIREYIHNICEAYRTAISNPKEYDLNMLKTLSTYDVDPENALSTQHLQLIYVYCDIIAYQYTGDIMARLLRVVHHNTYKSGNNAVAHYVFQPTYYLPVAVNSFETIEISLRNVQGQLLPFRAGPTPSHVVLHFRRRRQS